MASYTDLLREEIKFDNINKCCEKAVFLGLLYFCSSIKKGSKGISIEIRFREAYLFRKVLPVIKGMNLERSDIRIIYNVKNGMKAIVFDILESNVDGKPILQFLINESNIFNYLKDNCCFKEFLKMLLLINGRIVNPSKQYFLETNVKSHKKIADFLVKRLKTVLDVNLKINERSDSFIIYSKRFDNIRDILSFAGCSNLVLKLEELSMIKNIKSRVNRDINCEMSNINRKVKTGSEQSELFKEILDSELFDKLDNSSKKIINIRIDNPELSYSELGELCDMTKSQINYYLKKINRKYLKYISNLVKS